MQLSVTFLIGLVLTGCIVNPPASNAASTKTSANSAVISNTVTLPDTFNGAVADVTDYLLPTPVPTSTTTAKLSIVVNTGGSRANVRSGPGTNFPIVTKVNPGAAFTVISKSQDDTWWQICCVAVTGAITGTKASTGSNPK